MATFSPKKKSNCNRYCCVPQCTSLANRDRNVCFHLFPKDTDRITITNDFGDKEVASRKQLWIKQLRIGKTVSKSMVVCSKHFNQSQYLLPGVHAEKRRLKGTAVPTENLPVTSIGVSLPKEVSQARTKRLQERSNKQKKNPISQCEHTVDPSSLGGSLASTSSTYDIDAADSLLLLASQRPIHTTTSDSSTQTQTSGPKETRDIGVQVSSGDFESTIMPVINTETKLRTATGIPSFLVFTTIVNLFTEICPESNRCALSNQKKIMLTFIKLKLNWSFAILSMMFGCTRTTCSSVFSSTIGILAAVLQSAITWPSKIEIVSNMPKCFKSFPKVRVVLDCTEIKLCSYKCLKCRICSYSHYKGDHTVKFLLGVTPAGLISFVSKPFGGRASDKAIFVHSGLIDMVEEYIDDIMVDKGFLISEECFRNNIGLIHPPFLKKKKQFCNAEAIATCEIAKARVHVERAIERVKKFKIMSERLTKNLAHLSEDIMIVLCGIVNLGSPILADDKF